MNVYEWVRATNTAINRLAAEDTFVRTLNIKTKLKQNNIGKRFEKGRAVDVKIDVVQIDIFFPNKRIWRIHMICEDIPEHIIGHHIYHYLRDEFDKIFEQEIEHQSRFRSFINGTPEAGREGV
jgi:hypothetical protein